MKKAFLIVAIVVIAIVLIGFVALKLLSSIPIIRELKSDMKSFKEQEQKYIAMNNEELAALDDEELFDAVEAHLNDEIYMQDNIPAKLKNVSKEKRVFYTAYWFESEIQNGGLCQFFTNSSNATAPYVSEALEIIGANEQKELFSTFVKENNIDLNNLSVFESDDVDEYIEKTELLDFDSFDNSYYSLDESVPNVYDLLKIYARENVDKF